MTSRRAALALAVAAPLWVAGWVQPGARRAVPELPAVDVAAHERWLADCRVNAQAHHARDPYDPAALCALAANALDRARLTGDGRLYAEAGAALARARALPSRANDLAISILEIRVALARHRFGEAARDADRLRIAYPGQALPFALLGDAQLELGRLAEARAAYGLLARRAPGLSALGRLARLAVVTGDADAARAHFEAARAAAGYDESLEAAWIHAQLAALELDRGDVRRARVDADAALALAPELPLALATKARVLAAGSDPYGALTLLRRAVARHRDPAFLTELAAMYRTLGQRSESEVLYAEVLGHYELEVGAGEAGHRRALATLLLDRGQDAGRALALARADRLERADPAADALVARALAAVASAARKEHAAR